MVELDDKRKELMAKMRELKKLKQFASLTLTPDQVRLIMQGGGLTGAPKAPPKKPGEQ